MSGVRSASQANTISSLHFNGPTHDEVDIVIKTDWTRNWLVVIVAALGLTACGGGSDEGSDNSGSSGSERGVRGVESNNGLVKFANAFYAGPESQSLVMTGTFAQPENVIVTSDSGLISFSSVASNKLTLMLGEVDRPVNESVTLDFRYQDQSARVQVSVSIQNASAASLESQVVNTINSRSTVVSLSEDALFFNFFLQMAYLRSDITNQNLQARLQSFNPENSPWAFDVNFALDNLMQVKDRYRQGLVSEQVLRRELAFAERMIANHGTYGRDKLNEISIFVDAIAPDGLGSGVLEYVESTGVYSRILSSDHYVVASNGGLRLRPEYRALESLVQFN
ncbi:MAG: NOT2 / NOT3 / NOT5 family [Marinobacter excellens HL-55]|uniref:NOT2 / NOT3 / NOT5 family n=1 Tax=Marinobacter excellens HL-55 TaxID=1305731 RepID=A0A0P7YHP0_9GAMM|nr:MAG: NOT2 / NOT3 / NOT5 family [Marinobacter excellens HL-55]